MENMEKQRIVKDGAAEFVKKLRSYLDRKEEPQPSGEEVVAKIEELAGELALTDW